MRHAFFFLPGAALLGTSSPAIAQSAPSRPPIGTAAPAAEADPAAPFREALVNAQQEIARLRAEVGNRQDLETALRVAREKNERLVAITNQLIVAYEKRYRRGGFLPFDTGRRKFEAELQTFGDRVYDNRWDASPRRPAVASPSDAAPASPRRQTGQDGQ